MKSHTYLKHKRAERRRRTAVVARRRRAWHLERVHDRDRGAVDCVCELARTYFAKRPVPGCDCRGRTHGRPRLACGMCRWDWRRQLYRDRRLARENAWLIVTKGIALDDDAMSYIPDH